MQEASRNVGSMDRQTTVERFSFRARQGITCRAGSTHYGPGFSRLQAVCLEDLVPKDHFYRHLEAKVEEFVWRRAAGVRRRYTLCERSGFRSCDLKTK